MVEILESLHALEDTKEFLLEAKDDNKYDLHIYGIKNPVVSIQTKLSHVSKCVPRFNGEEPVSEADGRKLIWTSRNQIEGLDEEDAYQAIKKYLQQFLA